MRLTPATDVAGPQRGHARLPTLTVHAVVLWHAVLDAGRDDIARLTALLDEGERVRVLRLATDRLRRRQVMARGLLRLLLGHYTAADPRAVRLLSGPHGKPALAAGASLHFNVAHSGERALFALADSRPVGVDLEAVARPIDVLGVAAHAFSPDEQALLRSAPEGARVDVFYRLWTRKEAYVKARGSGLTYPMRSFTVSARADDDDALVADHLAPDACADWRVRSVAAPEGYCAALAAAGRDWTVIDAGELSPDATPGF
jgi:4'-phosphopantetheinyl transferase